MSKINDFRKLHSGDEPFILGNVWDAKSAQLAEKAGFKAVGISGHAIAENLGYKDGENMSFEELLFVVNRVIKSVSIPVSVDIDGGYGRSLGKVNEHIGQLLKMGAAGINIEDSVVKEGKRSLVETEKFTKIVRGIRSFLSEQKFAFFVNIRTDTYVTKHLQPLQETLKRVKTYEEAGADGIFVPLLSDDKEIKMVIKSTKLPLNVYLQPETPSYSQLKQLGVKRISSGAAVHAQSYGKANELYISLITDKRFGKLFN
ncbi:MAG: isocitrate lyase/phosphoenolpyruvate mutase family protein [Proteiniphilum sp.]|nr:isocitrate lyase/phosphoenolpyruvate mutase family protein [Proteiniphilum sp.]